jgi:hypothetical protein
MQVAIIVKVDVDPTVSREEVAEDIRSFIEPHFDLIDVSPWTAQQTSSPFPVEGAQLTDPFSNVL